MEYVTRCQFLSRLLNVDVLIIPLVGYVTDEVSLTGLILNAHPLTLIEVPET